MNYYHQRGNQKLGPMSWQAMVAAARAGSIARSDLVWADGWDAWRPAGSVDGLFAGSAIAPSSKSAGDDALMRVLLPVGRSGWAIAAGYLGLFALLIVPGPFALAAGIIAVMDLKRHPEKHGMGRAVFAIVIGTVATLILSVVVIGSIAGR